MPAPSRSSRARPESGARVVARALLGALAVGALVAAVELLLAGPAAGASALFGAAVALVFFACGGVLLVPALRRLPPPVLLLLAVCLYAGQVVGLFAAYLAADRVAGLDGAAAGIAVLGSALAWQGVQFVAWRRARILVYDEGVGERA